MNMNKFKKLVSEIKDSDIAKLTDIINKYEKIVIIGNGGSNAIASHIANDLTKTLNKKCLAFTDSSVLTCFMNDYGVEDSYKQFVMRFAEEDTLVILISSSGNSENIVRTAEYCVEKDIKFVTLTGFSEDNKVRTRFKDAALMDIWVDSTSYGIVECAHMVYLHGVIDV